MTSSLLPQGLLPAHLLGQPFVAFRDATGQARLPSDICVHRGGSLSAGRTVGDSVQCPYHGWQLDGARLAGEFTGRKAWVISRDGANCNVLESAP